jgi:glutaminyl-tRNA synthetase
LKAGQAFQPIRVAVCGRKNAPPLFETMVVLGRETFASPASARPKPAFNRSLELRTATKASTRFDKHGQRKRRDDQLESGKPLPWDKTLKPSRRTPSNFLRDIIAEDVRTKKYGDAVIQTRFPPEPNGYLHIGHAKAICIDFGLADEFGGKTNLRFDDTNPEKEEQEYVDSIMADVRWLGFEWDRLCYASDYFGQLYEWALQLIKAGKAYVDDLSADEIRQHRGTLTEPGKDSPYRNRSIEENLDLFTRMKAGEFPDGSRVLRAKIDMASPNLNMRDPVMYRILHATHQRTGDQWCIYPMYDYAHGQSDSLECVTHSMCTLEFTDHQPLYRWYIEQLGIFPRSSMNSTVSTSPTPCSASASSSSSCRKTASTAGTIPVCPPSAASAAAAFPLRLSAPSAPRSAPRAPTGLTDIEMLEHFQREELNRHSLPRHGCPASPQAGHRQLPRRP